MDKDLYIQVQINYKLLLNKKIKCNIKHLLIKLLIFNLLLQEANQLIKMIISIY
jgi:hypothetical protein